MLLMLLLCRAPSEGWQIGGGTAPSAVTKRKSAEWAEGATCAFQRQYHFRRYRSHLQDLSRCRWR